MNPMVFIDTPQEHIVIPIFESDEGQDIRFEAESWSARDASIPTFPEHS